jgi:peroxiredoxin
MAEQTNINKRLWILIVVAIGFITTGAVLAIINKQPAESKPVKSDPVKSKPVEQSEIAATNNSNLEDIIKSAQTWEAAFKPWSGKTAPDFTFTDLDGKQHSLKSYHGNNVMVVFWATWCPPCNREIPNLIELRKANSEDNLAIIAISDENPDLVKRFVAAKGINYTVASIQSGALPSPFADISSIPTTFFIDQNGKIKLATIGVVSPEETRAILKAES